MRLVGSTGTTAAIPPPSMAVRVRAGTATGPMCWGENTGTTAAFPLPSMAMRVLAEVATFNDAGVFRPELTLAAS